MLCNINDGDCIIHLFIELAGLCGMRCPPIDSAKDCQYSDENVVKMTIEEQLELNGECNSCWASYIKSHVKISF
jgi:hypothetical protein